MKSELLTAMREAGGYVSGGELSKKLGVSRTAVWKGMQKLKEEGYRIAAVPNKGYFLTESPDILNADELASLRKTAWAGKEIIYFEVTDSTNIQAKRLAEEGAPHGTLIVAGRQESGRGRRGRFWESPEGSGIFMTIVLRPDFYPGQASMLTIVAAMAVAKAIRTSLSLPAQIKWPNDIILNGKKICGILTEMNTDIDTIHYVVIGIGINVSNESFEGEAAAIATSLFRESGAEDLSEIQEEYNDYLVNKDRQVRILDPKEPFCGTAKGIAENGELIVETEHGVRRVSSGEVSVRGIYGYV